MQTTSVSTLRARLSRYLAAVRRGDTILILDRREPVAQLVPIDKAGKVAAGGVPEWFLVLARRGVVRLGQMRGCTSLVDSAPPGPARGTGAVEALLADRRSGR